MKNFATLIVLLLLSFTVAFAQKTPATRPLLFSKFPDTINCTATQLNNFFKFAEGQNVSVSLQNTLTLAGSVKSNLVKYSNLQTVVVKLPSFNNILFSLSKRTDDKKNIVYVAHLFDRAYADGYELKKIDAENYQLTKISTERVLQDCNQ